MNEELEKRASRLQNRVNALWVALDSVLLAYRQVVLLRKLPVTALDDEIRRALGALQAGRNDVT